MNFAINQLLGRLAYFHVLFIEPSVNPAPPSTASTCCRHMPNIPAYDGADHPLEGTPWNVLDQIGNALGVPACPAESAACCTTCRIFTVAEALSSCWLDVEAHAYGPAVPDRRRHASWSRTVASRMATAFVRQYRVRCSRPSELPLTMAAPPVDRFPLTNELTRFWADPADEAPVVSWLNHCSSITDIGHELATRRNTSDATTADSTR